MRDRAGERERRVEQTHTYTHTSSGRRSGRGRRKGAKSCKRRRREREKIASCVFFSLPSSHPCLPLARQAPILRSCCCCCTCSVLPSSSSPPHRLSLSLPHTSLLTPCIIIFPSSSAAPLLTRSLQSFFRSLTRLPLSPSASLLQSGSRDSEFEAIMDPRDRDRAAQSAADKRSVCQGSGVSPCSPGVHPFFLSLTHSLLPLLSPALSPSQPEGWGTRGRRER